MSLHVIFIFPVFIQCPVNHTEKGTQMFLLLILLQRSWNHVPKFFLSAIFTAGKYFSPKDCCMARDPWGLASD